MSRRVVITGMGAVTPLGLTLQNTWQNLMKAQSALAATQEAIENAGLLLETIDPTMFGISLGGNEETSKLSDFSNAFREDNLLNSLHNRDLPYFNAHYFIALSELESNSQ